jgi:hypothetical protein
VKHISLYHWLVLKHEMSSLLLLLLGPWLYLLLLLWLVLVI